MPCLDIFLLLWLHLHDSFQTQWLYFLALLAGGNS